MNAHRAYIGLGANVGDAVANVERGLAALAELGSVRRQSSLYRSRAWGKTDQADFVNAVALVETTLSPRELLVALQAIERRLGRRVRERWGPREIDLDVLTYDDTDVDEPGLRIPHADLAKRAFVLVPLAEIDSGYEPARRALADSEIAAVERLAQS